MVWISGALACEVDVDDVVVTECLTVVERTKREAAVRVCGAKVESGLKVDKANKLISPPAESSSQSSASFEGR